MSLNQQAASGKGLSELWRRLRFVLFAIIIYRIGTHIPIPGIDPDRLASLFEQNQGTLIDMFNMFSGGALERMSIMALNIMPYITASIIMSLLEGTNPSLKKKFREEMYDNDDGEPLDPLPTKEKSCARQENSHIGL